MMSEKEPPVAKTSIQSKDKLIESLNKLLSSELTALNQFTLHAGSLVGYKIMYDTLEKHSMESMKIVQQISSRILQLGGIPTVETLKGINYGKSMEEQLLNDLLCQQNKIAMYHENILLSKEQNDNETVKLLEAVLSEEEKHKIWIEAQIELIKKNEMSTYLQDQKLSL